MGSQLTKGVRSLGVLSSILLMIGSITFPAHEVLTVLGLLTLVYVFNRLGLIGRARSAELALILMIVNVVFQYVAVVVVMELYGPIGVFIKPYHVVMDLTSRMPLWLRSPSNQVAFTYAFAGAAWPLLIAYSYLLYRSISGLSQAHKYAGILLIIGAALYVAFVGTYVMLLAYALLLIAWLVRRVELSDQSVTFTRIHVIRLIAWSIAISLTFLAVLPLFVTINMQHLGSYLPMYIEMISPHPVMGWFTSNLSMVSIGTINATYMPNYLLVSVFGYVSVNYMPYYIKASVGLRDCSALVAVEPTTTVKSEYSIQYYFTPYGLPIISSPIATPSRLSYEGTAVSMAIKDGEVLWTFIPALSTGKWSLPVQVGFVTACLVSNGDYVFPINITIMTITSTHGNYFITNYGMTYMKMVFTVNKTTVRLVREQSSSLTMTSVNYANILPIIYIPIFAYYVKYDREFYRKLLIKIHWVRADGAS